jgi:hypothetical protein
MYNVDSLSMLGEKLNKEFCTVTTSKMSPKHIAMNSKQGP